MENYVFGSFVKNLVIDSWWPPNLYMSVTKAHPTLKSISYSIWVFLVDRIIQKQSEYGTVPENSL